MALLSGGRSASQSAAYKSLDRTNFYATAGQTTFTLSQGYSVGDIDVFLNGVKLVDSEDYYAITGTTVVLTTAAALNDHLQVVSYNQFVAANTYTKTEADSKYMGANGVVPMTSYLRTPNYGVSSYSDSATAALEASVGAGTQGTAVKVHGRSVATFGGDVHYVSDTRGAGGGHKFYGWNGSTAVNFMNIDSSGRVTKPLQPAFQARMTSSGGAGTLAFNATNVNIGNVFNTSNYRFTAPVAGQYWFHYHNNHSGGAGALYADFYKNGSFILYGRTYTQHTGSGWEELSGTIVASLAVGDYITVYLNSSHTADSGSYSSFCGGLIG